MSIEAKAQYLGRIYERYQRAGRQHKSRILDEFCEVCGYHVSVPPSAALTVDFRSNVWSGKCGSLVKLRHLPSVLGSFGFMLERACPCFGREIRHLPVSRVGQPGQDVA